MSYVILNPHSLTNPSDRYRVVDYGDWNRHADGRSPSLPVVSAHDSYASAQAAADGLNGVGSASPAR